jgi:Uma2 family endonuclease
MVDLGTYVSPPRTGMDVFKMLPEGTLCELINGIIYMSPAPLLNHQDTLLSLGSLMFNFVKRKKLGKIYVAPVDVYLNSKNAYQPDIVFVSEQNKGILKGDGIYGAPDLVVEILSPGTKSVDLTKKKSVYEKSGVKEYWVIEPVTKACVGFRLVDAKYKELPSSKGKFTSIVLKQAFNF